MDEMDMESVDLDEWEADRMFEVNVRKYKAKLRAEGRQEGMEKGMEKGIEKGREEGREEGRQEANLIHAREMKALNVDREIIKKVTGIDIDTIE
jgi:predicted transposase/invertase (TIGR01784 family)